MGVLGRWRDSFYAGDSTGVLFWVSLFVEESASWGPPLPLASSESIQLVGARWPVASWVSLSLLLFSCAVPVNSESLRIGHVPLY